MKVIAQGIAAAWAVVFVTSPLGSQSIAQRVGQAPHGRVRMVFAARPGVCGDGENIMHVDDTEDWERDCDPGPVHVLLTKQDGEIVRIRTFVSGRWRKPGGSTIDLGTVAASEAADYLASLAESADESVSRRAILPATLADSAEVWPTLVRIADDRSRPRRTRKEALQWLGIEASRVVTEGISRSEMEDDAFDVQASAVFALSQLPKREGIPALVRVARTHEDPRLRGKALFWLGQSGDASATAVFAEILEQQ